MENEEEDHALVADEETPTEFALMSKTSADSEVFDNSLCSKTYKKNTDSLNKLLKKEKEGLESKLTGFQPASKDLDSLLESQRLDKNKEGLGYSDVPPAQVYSPPKKDLSWTGLPEFADDTVTDYSRPSPAIESTSDDVQNRNPSVTETEASPNIISSKPFIKFVKLGNNFVMKKACYNYGGIDHLSYDYGKWVDQGRSWEKNNNTHKSRTPRTVFHKTARSQMRTNRKFPTVNRKFPIVNRKFPTGNTKFSTADMGHKGKANHIDDKGYWDSGCSRHMTGNISYLTKYEPYDGGYVSFRQGRCKTTGKGTIKTSKLEFENVYFVKDLKYNLFSVSQICDNKNNVLFTDSECIVLGRNFKLTDDANVLLRTPRQHNMYTIDLNNIVPHKDLTCLVAKASADECMLWHRRLGHLNFKTMNRLVRHNLVRGLPSKCFNNDHTCAACLKGKQHKVSCKTKLVNSVTKPLHTLHMDLFGPTSDETNGILRNFITEIENLKELKVKIIRCDNKGEFRNKEMNYFCSRKGIKREFSNARTPQQNRVAKRRNGTLIEAGRTMVLVNKSQIKTPYELFNGRSPAIGFLKPFGCHVMILNTLDNLGKFEAKGDEGYFIGYKGSCRSRCEERCVFFKIHCSSNWFHEAHLESSTSNAQDTYSADAPESSGNSNPTVTSTNPPANHMETLAVETPIPTVSSPVLTACLNDSPEPSSDTRLIFKRVTSQDDTPSLDNILTLTNRFEDILGVTTNTGDTNGVEVDLRNIETTITASPTPTLRIYKDHLKSQIIGPVDTPIQTRNKLVAQGHTQEEGVNYDEVFAPVVRTEAIRLFLAYASFMGFTIYQMDVKSVFLYGTIDEEVYVMGTIDQTLFIRRHRGDFILVQVYVDDIIFGSSNPQLCREFEALMYEKFQMSAMGEFNFLLGLQVLQKKDGIFLSQDKYVRDILKKFGYSDVRSANTPMDKENPWGKNGTGKDVDLHHYRSMIGSLMYLTASRPNITFAVCACARYQVTPKECHLHAVKRIFRYLKGHPKLGLWYPKESPFDLVAYSDSDYGGASQDRKSTTGGCQFLGRRLISWQCEKQTIMATSTTEAEYVAAASGCRQVLWIQNQLLDYGDCFEKKLISVDHIHTDENVADLLTKPIDAWRFQLSMPCEALSKEISSSILLFFSERTVPLFPSMLVTMGEGSGTPIEAHHTPTTEATPSPQHELSSSSSFPPVTTESFPIVIPIDNPPLRKYTRRTRIAQSSVLLPVADEHASPLGNDSQGEACLTDSSFGADQDRENIAKTSTLPSDSTLRVTSLGADEGSIQQKLDELTALCTSLQRQQSEMVSKFVAQELEITNLKARVKLLEDREGGGIAQSGDDALIKGRSLDEGEEEAERVSDDTKEMATVLTSMDAASILTSEGVQVVPTAAEVATATVSIPTGSRVVFTASPTIPTAAPIFTTATESTPYTRRKGKETMVESETLKKKKIARDAEIARIHVEEELQMLIDGLDRNNETVAKYLQEYYQFAAELPIERKIELISDLGMTLEEIKEKFDLVWKQFQDFISIGSKEKAERFKRKGVRLEQDSSKKLKTSEEVPEEELKEMMELIPVEEVDVEALQVKHHIINWEHLDREDLNQLWALVKETLSIRPAVNDKEKELWVKPKRLYEPDVEDLLWTHTQNLIHAPVEWKLYDTCGVHHVENYSQMGNDLILKIYKIASSSRQQGIPTSSDEFPLPEQLPTANEDKFSLLIQSDATAEELCAAAEVKE
uniref:Integrase catalytic domain-containing protein n=1 Tax=Tanacetum cinerariifolium TaxID=118510 RepID=A0A6L2JDY1_TANCI|nr:hypothetical protein [Tanacetum cinerariifolium]